MSLAPPAEIKGKFLMLAEVTAVEGKGDDIQKYLSAISKVANSSEEPNTLSYRTTRGVGSDSNKFTVIEEYADKAAMDHHLSSDAFKSFFGSGAIANVQATFREEF
ncbi:hypothetical protein PM082_016917 [Marasmius tenuissimus]|nr:hypothetical protein PM082_016917 [Marasmius tenuissimus]